MSFLSSHPNSFVHLHLHTQYSLLDGMIRTHDLVERACEWDMPAVAQTDHGNMFGAIDFYTKACAKGLRPILGSEIYFTPGSRLDKKALRSKKTVDSQDEQESRHHIHHLILLCKNKIGYQNLCQIISKAYLEGFYYKPRADLSLLREYSEGLIATTACLKGEVSYNLFTQQEDRATSAALALRDIFGDDFYLEIQENGIPEQKLVNERLIALSKEKSIPLVATNDCHYLSKEDAKAQEVLLCVQTNKTLYDEKRMKLTTSEFYFKSAEEMRKAFSYIPEACDNTLRIADQCQVELSWKDSKGQQIYHLPDFEIETEEGPEEYLRRKCREGLRERFSGPHFVKLKKKNDNWDSELRPQYEKRLEEELDKIIKMGFAGYFLIVADFIAWAKKEGIPVGPGRGSGAGSLVAYALTITNIDPLVYNLLFERFINPERISMPDFDIDFCQNRRGEVIDYVTRKYSKERVGQIITFGKMLAKAVLRDVSRVFGLVYAQADFLAKLVPNELGMTLQAALEIEPKIREMIKQDEKIGRIMKIALKLEGLLRHASIHAAGVIITNRPLVSYCPLFKGRDGEQVVQFDKDFSEQIGLVKFDFLGLKTLTAIEGASELIRRDKNSQFDIEEIDMEDAKVYQLISEGKTKGVFQLESSGMTDLCKRIRPDSIEDITAINALYRPGPLESGMVDDFIDVKQGKKDMHFPFPELGPVLKDTYGVIVYQEQVMSIARIIAGYGLGEADMLRRAMGKKKVSEMKRHREIFLRGATQNNYNKGAAENLYDLMANFAAYGFNKSHAVAYAVIAYQTAFLKCHYSAQFFAALLSTELGNLDKVRGYINDAKDYGIKVLPPDINESLWAFNVVGGNIRFGMGAIKSIGPTGVEEIVRQRQKGGAFTGLLDFCERVNSKLLPRTMLSSLIKVGAFDQCQKLNRKTLLENMELATNYGLKRQKEKESGQISLFDISSPGAGPGQEVVGTPDFSIHEDFASQEKLQYEADLIGIYISGHPLDRFAYTMEQVSSMSIFEVHQLEGRTDKREMVLSGMITSRRDIVTKRGDKMCFAVLEDLTGQIECIIFPRVFAEYESILEIGRPLALEGDVKLGESPIKIMPRKIMPVKELLDEKVTAVRVHIPMENLDMKKLDQLKQTLQTYRGSVPLQMIFEGAPGRARLPLGENYYINPSSQMAAKVNDIFSSNSVKFIIDGRPQEALM